MPASPRVTVRPARPEDAPGIGSLAEALAPSNGERPSPEGLALLLARCDHMIFVAADGDEIKGWIHAYVAERVQRAAFVEIGGLVVSSAVRRCGIASRLLDAVTGWAEGRGVAEVRVRVRDDRSGAIAFYGRQGFVFGKKQLVLSKKRSIG